MKKSRGPTNNETYLTSLPDYKFTKEVIKMLKELRKTINKNAKHCNKELKTINRKQSKLDNSIAKIKTELKAGTSRLNNAEKWISDLENRIMEIIQSEQQTEDKY